MDASLENFVPHAIHIATEGSLGAAARKWCLRKRVPFTSSYHTQFPEYVRARVPIPLAITYAYLRRFHHPATRTMVSTPTLEQRLKERGFAHLVRWTRGVNVDLFKPQRKGFLRCARPISIYVGRVSVEKNVEAFLRLNLPGTKVVVGDGPARAKLQVQYPDVLFAGYRYGEELAQYLADADVFVFASRTDTFGLVLLEAMACGVPIAAYPVAGPLDVVQQDVTGILDENLERAAHSALNLNPRDCRNHALRFTWEAASQQFLDNLQPISWPSGEATSQTHMLDT
jgi:glycosyltransferase involved in cell wall biosynthesis